MSQSKPGACRAALQGSRYELQRAVWQEEAFERCRLGQEPRAFEGVRPAGLSDASVVFGQQPAAFFPCEDVVAAQSGEGHFQREHGRPFQIVRPRAVRHPECAERVRQLGRACKRPLHRIVVSAIERVSEGLHLRRHHATWRDVGRLGRRRRGWLGGARRRRRARSSSRALRHPDPSPAADRDVRLRGLHRDFVRAAIAVVVSGLDAEEVVRGQLGADAGERRLGVSDLDAEERSSGGARELLQPSPHQRAVAAPVDEALVAQSRLGREPIHGARLDVQGVDRGVGERGFLSHLNSELAEIGTSARRVTRDHAPADRAAASCDRGSLSCRPRATEACRCSPWPDLRSRGRCRSRR